MGDLPKGELVKENQGKVMEEKEVTVPKGNTTPFWTLKRQKRE